MRTFGKSILIAVIALVLALGVGALAGQMQNPGTYSGSKVPQPVQVRPESANTFFSYSATSGNTTGASSSVDLGYYVTDHSCMAYVTNSGGAVVANTATVVLQGSLDNSQWVTVQSQAVTASTVHAFRNTGAAAVRYVRANISAIQNANSSYVNFKCVSRADR